MQDTKSCNRIKSNKLGPALQTSTGKPQWIFQILYCHKYKHERWKKPINFLNKSNSMYLLCQERHKNHINSLNKWSEIKPTGLELQTAKATRIHQFDLDMTSRMRYLSCNGSIQSTFKNPPYYTRYRNTRSKIDQKTKIRRGLQIREVEVVEAS